MGWKIKALGKRHNSFKVSEYKMPEQLENGLNAKKDAFYFCFYGMVSNFVMESFPKGRGVGGKLKVR